MGVMGKVNNMQEQIHNTSREMEILRKKQNEMLEVKKTVTKMKSAFDGLLVDSTWPRKESENLKIGQQKLPKLKCKEKNGKKKSEKYMCRKWGEHTRSA